MSLSRPNFAVIGDPVEHSLSPRIFAHLFHDLQINAHYSALKVQPHELPALLEKVGAGALKGVSVTIPLKEAIVEHLDDLHPTARRIGAVNCVAQVDGRLVGFNTDAVGFQQALEARGPRLAAARVVLLGAGGAARAAAFAAASAGAKSLVVANRDPARALTLARELCEAGWAWPEGEAKRALEAAGWALPPTTGPSGRCYIDSIPLEAAALKQALFHADIVVNATPLGWHGHTPSPLPDGVLPSRPLTHFDMVYRPRHTDFLLQSEGGMAIDGLWMLIYQAVEQLRIWTGHQVAPPLVEHLHNELAKEIAT